MTQTVAIEGVDHLVFAVRSLETAARRFRNLGFLLTPKGGHPALGSANHTFVFRDGNYGELLAAERDGPFTTYYRAFARAREGLAGLAFRIPDAGAARTALLAAGFTPDEPMNFTRPVEIGGKVREARFTIIQLPPGSLPGGHVFFVRHGTPELVWRPDMLDHPNGVTGIAAVVLACKTPEAAAAAYNRLGVRLEMMTCAAFAERFREEPLGERFAAVRFRVADLDRTAAVLTVSGTRFVETENAIEVPAGEALGTRLIFQRG